jgi:hypothetical protein
MAARPPQSPAVPCRRALPCTAWRSRLYDDHRWSRDGRMVSSGGWRHRRRSAPSPNVCSRRWRWSRTATAVDSAWTMTDGTPRRALSLDPGDTARAGGGNASMNVSRVCVPYPTHVRSSRVEAANASSPSSASSPWRNASDWIHGLPAPSNRHCIDPVRETTKPVFTTAQQRFSTPTLEKADGKPLVHDV